MVLKFGAKRISWSLEPQVSFQYVSVRICASGVQRPHLSKKRRFKNITAENSGKPILHEPSSEETFYIQKVRFSENQWFQVKL